MTTVDPSIEQLAINTIRTLSIDAIEQANSGHPGITMGAAPMAYVLWTKLMKHNPANPSWFNRDRFVLSAGHGSMLLYSLLHLCGYPIELSDIKQFRQWNSITPGHPEYGHTPGVEATTGPLGQGIGMAVGMAMAERHLAAIYNRPGHTIIDHYTYVLCGDGDLMEGISSEAASLAGHLKLGRLIVLYDSNQISLDGETSHAFTDDIAKRFEAYGWQYMRVEDGNDIQAIYEAIDQARKEQERPTLIEIRTVIGYGSPNKAGKSDVHGAPLGSEEVKRVKKAYGWPGEEPFYVPEAVRELFAEVKRRGEQEEAAWLEKLRAYEEAHPQLAAQLKLAINGQLPAGWDDEIPSYSVSDKAIATRSASGEILNAIARRLPTLIGGSADLASSNKTLLKGEETFRAPDYTGRNIWFGVREHAMGAALNGMLLHGGVRVYGGTFLVFSDYLRPAIRLAAIMKLPVVYVFTHDSIAVGEDGPTHEPIEHLPSLRAIPGLYVLRPADANETAAAYRFAVQKADGPVAMILTRQNLPILEGTKERAPDYFEKGAYILSEPQEYPQGILLATGSEVSLALRAQQQLLSEGYPVRVVSMPSWELFERQDQSYRDSVLPPSITARLAIEMARPLGWERYVGDKGAILGIDTFGASAPGERVMKEFGFTVEHVVEKMKRLLNPSE
jgi:transketolase